MLLGVSQEMVGKTTHVNESTMSSHSRASTFYLILFSAHCRLASSRYFSCTQGYPLSLHPNIGPSRNSFAMCCSAILSNCPKQLNTIRSAVLVNSLYSPTLLYILTSLFVTLYIRVTPTRLLKQFIYNTFALCL